MTRRELLRSTLLLSVAPGCLARPSHAQDGSPVQPYFLLNCKTWQGVDFRKSASPFPFTWNEPQIQQAIDHVITAMHDTDMALPSVADRDVLHIGHRISVKVDTTLGGLPKPEAKGFTRQWLLAEAVCAWVGANLHYDHAFEKELNLKGGWNALPSTAIRDATTSGPILLRQPPSAVCWGIAVTVRDIARSAGLKCDFVNGNFRWLGNTAPAQTDRNHGTVCFTFDGGIEVPANVSSYIGDEENSAKPFPNRKTHAYMVLPRHPEAWEIYLATFNSDVGAEMSISGDKQNIHKYLTMSYSDWAHRDTRYLNPLMQAYHAWELNRQT